jgi:hypothetical protein
MQCVKCSQNAIYRVKYRRYGKLKLTYLCEECYLELRSLEFRGLLSILKYENIARIARWI